jgi:preprotein translocase subunit SecA
MNKQREIIYGERRKILEGTDTRENLMSMLEQTVRDEVPGYCEGRHRENWDLEGLWERMRQIAPLPELETVNLDSLGDGVDDIADTLVGEMTALYEEREQQYGAELMRSVEQSLMLNVIDTKWRAYLTDMEHLREGINLQAYGQKDPLVEYKQAAFESFQGLTADIKADIVRLLMHVQIQRVETAPSDPTDAASEAVAPSGGRADNAGAVMSEDAPPPARPAAAAASAALARATGAPRPAPLSPLAQPALTNIVESSSAGTRSLATPGNGGGGATAPAVPSGGVAVGTGKRKVGRNEPCPCGSGRKYKLCHGR